jgi:hypothetical protein
MEIKQPLNNPCQAYLPSVRPIPEGYGGRLPTAPGRDHPERPGETIYLRQEDLTVLPADDREVTHVTYDGGGRVVSGKPSAAPARKGLLIDVRA